MLSQTLILRGRVGIGDAVPDDLNSLFGPAASTLFNVTKSAYGGDGWIKQVRNISPGLGNLLMATQGNFIGNGICKGYRGSISEACVDPFTDSRCGVQQNHLTAFQA